MDDDSLFSYFVVVESISESIVHWNKSWQIAIFSFCLSCFSYSCLIFANFNSDLNGNIWFIKEWNLIFQFFEMQQTNDVLSWLWLQTIPKIYQMIGHFVPNLKSSQNEIDSKFMEWNGYLIQMAFINDDSI